MCADSGHPCPILDLHNGPKGEGRSVSRVEHPEPLVRWSACASERWAHIVSQAEADHPSATLVVPAWTMNREVVGGKVSHHL